MPTRVERYVAPEMLKWFRTTGFRRAVAHSIDKDRIIDEVQHGQGYPQWASVSPAAGDFHNPNVRRYEYDLAKANEILDGLGWLDTDGDGIREDGEGNEIEFTLVTNEGNTVRQAVGEIVREGLQAIGVRADYRIIPFGDLVSPAHRHLRLGGHDHRLHRRPRTPTVASASGTAARACTCGTPTSRSPPPSGRP